MLPVFPPVCFMGKVRGPASLFVGFLHCPGCTKQNPPQAFSLVKFAFRSFLLASVISYLDALLSSLIRLLLLHSVTYFARYPRRETQSSVSQPLGLDLWFLIFFVPAYIGSSTANLDSFTYPSRFLKFPAVRCRFPHRVYPGVVQAVLSPPPLMVSDSSVWLRCESPRRAEVPPRPRKFPQRDLSAADWGGLRRPPSTRRERPSESTLEQLPKRLYEKVFHYFFPPHFPGKQTK